MKKRSRKLFLPAKHTGIINKIYANLGIYFEPGKSPEIPATLNGRVQSNYYAGWGFGVITVEQPGKNSFNEIKHAFYNLLFNLKADVIFLFITMESADVSELVQQVENEKFFFCGIAPSLINGSDALRFEYLNGTIDASKINIYGNKAQEIFNYILSEKERVLQ